MILVEIQSDEQIEDWTVELHSLEHLTENISQLDLRLSCTASASSGPSIAWHVYFPLCDVWNTLHQMTELGVLVEDRATSPCLKTSTLTISDYAERGYHGAVIKCRASATRISKSSYKKITIQGKIRQCSFCSLLSLFRCFASCFRPPLSHSIISSLLFALKIY